MQGKTLDEVLAWLMTAKVECETPNEYLYKFEGNYVLQDGSKLPIDPDQVLLKGSCLRNTAHIYGLCVYTGHDTKIMKNSSNSVSKRSKNAQMLNVYVLYTMILQLLASVIGAVILTVWTEHEGHRYWYIYPN